MTNSPPPNHDDEDDALMCRAAKGDGAAFGVLVSRHQGLVTRVACRLMAGDAWAAEDIAQEAFLRVWRAAAKYDAQGSFVAYLLTVTRHVCEDVRRRLPRHAPLFDVNTPGGAPSPDAAATAEAMADAVRLAVAALPDGQREVFVLSHYEGLSYKEIADILDCPMGTVASRKHLATENLRRALRDWLPNGGAGAK